MFISLSAVDSTCSTPRVAGRAESSKRRSLIKDSTGPTPHRLVLGDAGVRIYTQQTRYIDAMLVQWWTSVVDGGPTVAQHSVYVSCLLLSTNHNTTLLFNICLLEKCSICLLEKWVDTAFWLCTAADSAFVVLLTLTWTHLLWFIYEWVIILCWQHDNLPVCVCQYSHTSVFLPLHPILLM